MTDERDLTIYPRLRELLDPALGIRLSQGFSWPAATAFVALDLDETAQRRAVELCVEAGWRDQAALDDPAGALRGLLIDSPTLPPPGHSRWW